MSAAPGRALPPAAASRKLLLAAARPSLWSSDYCDAFTPASAAATLAGAALIAGLALGGPGLATWRARLAGGAGGGAAVLGRADIGALEAGRRADFFTVPLDGVATAGALADPVAAAVFCAPQPARHVVVQGRPVVRDGALLTIDLPAVVREHNRHAALMRG